MPSNQSNFESLLSVASKIVLQQQRDAFLDDVCKGDPALRQKIEQSLKEPITQFAGHSEDELSSIAKSREAHRSAPTLDLPRVQLRGEGSGQSIGRESHGVVPRVRVDRYALSGEIARGGMGAIIKAHDKEIGRDLAIKVLLETHKDSSEVIRRFVEEAQIGGQLQHPGIAPVYELGMFEDDRPYFTMKLVKGKDLAVLLQARADLSEDRAKYLGIFEQVCQTMAYAHSRGVIHRDLKPANIMVGAFGEVQVMDWGLAKVLVANAKIKSELTPKPAIDHSVIHTHRSDRSTLSPLDLETQMGSVLGTPAYMPPEQALGEVDRLNERCDVFALGGLLVHILIGRAPYSGDDSQEVFRKATRGNLNECMAMLEGCRADETLLKIAHKCLQVDPENRYANAREVATEVSEYLESVEKRLRHAEVETAEQVARAEESLRTAENAVARATAERRTRRLQLTMATIVLLFTTTGALITAMFLRKQQSQTELVADALAQKSDSLYVAHLQMAQQDWRDGAVRRVRELLDKDKPSDTGGDRRSFEWYFLDKLCKRAESTPAFESDDIISNVVVAPDGRFACLALNDSSIRIIDLMSLKQIAALVGHQSKVLNITVSTDGNTILSCDEGEGFIVWTRQADSFSPLVSGRTVQPHHVRLSPDARFVIAPEQDSIKLYDLTLQMPGQPQITSLPLSSPVGDLAWMNDKRHFLAAFQDGVIGAFDVQLPMEMKPLLALEQAAVWMAIASDDRKLAVGSQEAVRLYSISDTLDMTLNRDLGRPDGRLIYLTQTMQMFAAVTDRNASFWNFETGLLGGRIEFKSEEPTRLTASRHAELVATAGTDHLVKIWDPQTGKLRSEIKGHSNTVYGVDFTNLGAVVSGGRDRVLQVADATESAKEMTLHGHSNRVWSISYSPSGEQIASGSEDMSVIIWEAATGRLLKRLTGHTDSVQNVRYSPTEAKLASSSRDGTIKLWDLESGELVGEFLGHKGAVNTLDYSRDGSHLVSGSDDGSAIIWDTSTRLPVQKLENIPGKIWCVTFSIDNSVVVGGTNNQVLQWHPDSKNEPKLLMASDFNITSLRFSHDGKTLACTMSDGTIALIDFEYLVVNSRPTAHTGDAIGAAFSPDGHTLATCGSDARIHFWNRKLMEPTIEIDAHNAHIQSIDFSPDGTNLASGSWDSSIKIWSTK